MIRGGAELEEHLLPDALTTLLEAAMNKKPEPKGFDLDQFSKAVQTGAARSGGRSDRGSSAQREVERA